MACGAPVSTLRRLGPDALRAAARAFSRVAWPAFGVLPVTGAWNVAVTGADDGERTMLLLKLTAVSAVLALPLGVLLRG